MPISVSVVMSVYNDQTLVSRAIESILNQTFTDFELIIIDDGSSDNSVIEIKKFDDARIRFFQQPNLGLAKSLNFGIEVGLGKYIARQDSDDYSMSFRLAKQVDFLEINPEFGLIGCNVTLCDEEGQTIASTNYPTDNSTLQWMLLDNRSSNPINHGTAMFHRELAINVGGYREEFKQSQDLDLWLRMAEKKQVANLPECAYVWQLRRKSVTMQSWHNQRDFGYLARLCARHRRSGRLEPKLSLMTMRRPVSSNLSLFIRPMNAKTEYEFRIALILFNNDQSEKARPFLLKVLHQNPFHGYAWLLLGLSVIPRKLNASLYHWVQILYHRIILK
jgi:glycosyltransferase involved in cell wall biosynthesis